MMANDSSRNDLQSEILAKAGSDPEFRSRLQKDPRTTLEGEISRITGKDFKLPADIEIVLLEDSPKKLHVVLPPLDMPEGDRELTDAELETVAGGSACTYMGISIGGCCGQYTSTFP